MPDDEFQVERQKSRASIAADGALTSLAGEVFALLGRHQYSYNFDWLGLPIIQYPPDIVAIQEVLWRVQPRVVVETGVARGGSLALSASLLELMGGDGFVIGIDIDIRPRNREAIEAHPLASRIKLVEGSSVDPDVVAAVYDLVGSQGPVVVLLDSMHTHDHVLAELRAYSGLVQPQSYLVVFDTVIEHLPAGYFPDRPWGPGNSPMTAVREFLASPGCRFEVDEEFDAKLVISVAPHGYLRCVE